MLKTNLYNVVNFLGTGTIKIGNTPLLRSSLTREQAVNLAAYLLAAAYANETEIAEVLSEARGIFAPQEVVESAFSQKGSQDAPPVRYNQFNGQVESVETPEQRLQRISRLVPLGKGFGG